VTPDLSFVLHGNPLSQNAIYRRGRGKRLYMSDEGRSYIANVGLAATMAIQDLRGPWSQEGRFAVELTMFFSSQRPDGDGPLKPTLDALQKIVYDNDRQVTDGAWHRRVDPQNPRLEVRVYRMETK
jgi:Holliday junction resolvase RusA-like endonuclease